MLLLILRVTPERDPLLLLLGGYHSTLKRDLTFFIDWNKLTPVFPTFTHSFKERTPRNAITPSDPETDLTLLQRELLEPETKAHCKHLNNEPCILTLNEIPINPSLQRSFTHLLTQLIN